MRDSMLDMKRWTRTKANSHRAIEMTCQSFVASHLDHITSLHASCIQAFTQRLKAFTSLANLITASEQPKTARHHVCHLKFRGS
jgi:hypothetical protein